MPWSIFSDGGGDGAAATWAGDLLGQIGAPQTVANEQVIYDWEVSEGGGGKYNPLNQGPVPGQSQLTSTGPQFGGGAADYVSWAAGLQGAADYLGMPNFSAIRAALVANNAEGARTAIITSPWAASHYGGGSAFSDAPLPGKASALSPDGGDATGASASTVVWYEPWTWFSGAINSAGKAADKAAENALHDAAKLALTGLIVVGGGVLVIWGIGRATGAGRRASAVIETAGAAAPAVA